MINIVFEGAPGSGKTTIINELVKRLKVCGINVGKTVDIDSTTPLYPILNNMNNNTPLITSNENFNTVLYETFVQISDYLYTRERLLSQNNAINLFDRAYFSIYAYQKVLLEEKYGNECDVLLKNILSVLKFKTMKIDILFYFEDNDNFYLERAQKRNNKKFTNYEIDMLNLFDKELSNFVQKEKDYLIVNVKNENLDSTIDVIFKKIIKFYELRRK